MCVIVFYRALYVVCSTAPIIIVVTHFTTGPEVSGCAVLLQCALCDAALMMLMSRAGQNRIYAPYMTVYLVISLPKLPYTHRIYNMIYTILYI
jgi:hypothetical protein